MSVRLSAEKWAELVSAWDASGQTGRAFAEAQGITESSLRWWKRELPRRARKVRAQPSPPGQGRATDRAIALARVIREMPPTMIELQLDGVRVAVGRGFDAELLREVVHALSVRK